MTAPAASQSYPCASFSAGEVHGKKIYLQDAGNTRKQQETEIFQRSFPWMQSVAAPSFAPRDVVTQVKDYGMAVRVALKGKPGGPWTQNWLAERIKVSRGYMSKVLSDPNRFQHWMIDPICWATGSWLVKQFHDLQEALNQSEHDIASRVTDRLAERLRAAA